MARWEPGARERLERAALELFTEVGFAETTVPQITARAGLTTRTFFRHFADKREVLFAGEDEYLEHVAGLIAAAPAELGPMVLAAHGLPALAEEHFEGKREQLRARRTVVTADEGLRERELRKREALGEVIAHGYRARGVDELTAVLAARVGVAAFGTAVTRWLDADDERPLVDHVHEALTVLGSLTADLADVVGRSQSA